MKVYRLNLLLATSQGPGWYFPNNQVNGWTTDGAGNVTGVGSMQRNFSYDAENRQLSATINGVETLYRYDGDGRRVQKVAGALVTTYVYDAMGDLAAEYSNQSVGSPCGTQTCFVTVDHLGSTRLLTDSFGNVAKRYDYLPFGVELFAGTNGRSAGIGYTSSGDGFSPKFTGMNRDAETGLYYFNARYYSAAQGRFTSPDPGNAGANVADPQTWNGYAYVNNSPLNYTDPTGEGIFGTIFGVLAGVFTANPWIGLAASAAGNGIDAAIWGPQAAGIPGTSFNLGSFTSCGGPLGNCGSIGGIWTEQSPIGPSVQDPGRFIQSFSSADPPTGFSFGYWWLHGLLPRTIYYPANSRGTQDMRRSTVVQQLRSQYIGGGCPVYLRQESGHFNPWRESALNGVFRNTTQFEVGGFLMHSAASPDGAMVSHTIRNTTGWSSLTGFSTWGGVFGARRNALDTNSGPGKNVEQVFSWSEPNPCR